MSNGYQRQLMCTCKTDWSRKQAFSWYFISSCWNEMHSQTRQLQQAAALLCAGPTAGMIMLEASVVVYLLQGYTASGRKVRLLAWPIGSYRISQQAAASGAVLGLAVIGQHRACLQCHHLAGPQVQHCTPIHSGRLALLRCCFGVQLE